MRGSVDNITRKARVGFLWSAAERWVGQIFGFVSVVVLARLLAPESFGLVATAAIFVSSALLLVEQGLGDALVQRQTLEDIHYSSVFWMNLAIAVLCSVTLFLFAGKISEWLEMEALARILRALAVVPIISAVSKVHEARLRRNLDFRGLAIRRIGASFAGLGVAIAAAYSGLGAMSLVIQQVVAEAVGTVVLWKSANWCPKLVFSPARLGDLFGFGMSMLALSLLTLAHTRVDDLAVSIYLGASSLGIYTIAYSFLKTINSAFNGVVLRVAFSHFCRLQGNEGEMKLAFGETFKLAAYPGFCVFSLLITQSKQVIYVFFGEKWIAATVVMQILALSAFFQLPTSFQMLYIRSLGLASLNMNFMLGLVVVLATGVMFCASFGLNAVAAAVTIVTALGFGLSLVISSKVSPFRINWIARTLLVATTAAIVSMIVSTFLGFAMNGCSETFLLIWKTVAGIIVYGGVVILLDKEVCRLLMGYLSERR